MSPWPGDETRPQPLAPRRASPRVSHGLALAPGAGGGSPSLPRLPTIPQGLAKILAQPGTCRGGPLRALQVAWSWGSGAGQDRGLSPCRARVPRRVLAPCGSARGQPHARISFCSTSSPAAPLPQMAALRLVTAASSASLSSVPGPAALLLTHQLRAPVLPPPWDSVSNSTPVPPHSSCGVGASRPTSPPRYQTLPHGMDGAGHSSGAGGERCRAAPSCNQTRRGGEKPPRGQAALPGPGASSRTGGAPGRAGPRGAPQALCQLVPAAPHPAQAWHGSVGLDTGTAGREVLRQGRD